MCYIDILLGAEGGYGVYSYYRDKDIEDPEYKIVDRYPGDYLYTMLRPNAWGGPVGFIVWAGLPSGFTPKEAQRATTQVWVPAEQVQCP
jgi:hypothetical protein